MRETPEPGAIPSQSPSGSMFDLFLAAAAGMLTALALAHLARPLPMTAFPCLAGALVLLGTILHRAGTRTRTNDRTHRLAAELRASVRSLAASEERYRTIVEHAGDPILTFDLAEKVTSMNRAAERVLGWERDALVGTPVQRLLAEESVRAIRRWLHEGLLTPTDPVQLELTAVHREGRILHLEAHTSVLRGNGTPVGVEVVCRDVTVRRELDRLRADFLAMVGHDIRNPLGAIFGYTEMMLDAGSPLAPEHRELLLRINSNTRTVLTLVVNFLEVSKIEAGHLLLARREVDVNAIVRRTTDQYTAHAQLKGTDLLVELAPDLPAIAADGLQIERIVANLVTNAIKFTPRGGQVTVTTERLPSSVALAVADTGVGIAPHEFSRIFQRYTRSGNRTAEGTGLGLYIVGTLVEAHGGFVTIDSTPGRGATFTAYLPIADWRRADADLDRPALAPASSSH